MVTSTPGDDDGDDQHDTYLGDDQSDHCLDDDQKDHILVIISMINYVLSW